MSWYVHRRARRRQPHPPFNRPLLDPGRLPSFIERLALIGKQILQYPLSDEVAGIAAMLVERYMPAAALI